MQDTFKYPLGSKARCIVDGFTGVLVAATRYLSGCNRYMLQAESRDGKPGETYWCDEPQLEIVGPGVKVENVRGVVSGGDGPSPPSRDPR